MNDIVTKEHTGRRHDRSIQNTGAPAKAGRRRLIALNGRVKVRHTLRAVAVALAFTVLFSGCDVFDRVTSVVTRAVSGGGASETTAGGAQGAEQGSQAGAGQVATTEVAGENVETVFAVNVTPAVQGEIKNYLEVNGDVEAAATIDVFADQIGELKNLRVRVGQWVRQDQVLAEVDPSRPGQNFVASPVKAPISGTITSLPAREGATITQAQPVAQIARTSELEIIVQIAERFISKVEEGFPAIVRFDAYPDERFDAVVTETSPVVDPMTRTLEVKLRLTSRDSRIKAGMFAEVRIITEQKDDIVKLPADCLIRRFGQYFVFVVNGDQVERREVNPGIEIDNKVEITEGLEPGELVVYQGQSLLEDGATVRVINTIEPLSEEDVIQ